MTVLSTIASALQAVVAVAEAVTKVVGAGAAAGSESHQALDSAVTLTLREWQHVAVIADPRIGSDLHSLELSTNSERARSLILAAEKYLPEHRKSPHRLNSDLELRHSVVETRDDGALKIDLGASAPTRALRGEQAVVTNPIGFGRKRRDDNPLPVFNVTMLGSTGCGKTVFMAAMYAQFRDGIHGLSIRASNDVDLELGRIFERIYEYNKWPAGTGVNDSLFSYDFELIVDGTPIARIDWVDYRGGALQEEDGSANRDGEALRRRLRESDSIIWMIDMGELKGREPNTVVGRTKTSVARMKTLCENALSESDLPRTWIFVRTKSDAVQDLNGNPDWSRACDELIQHLTPILAMTHHPGSRAAAMPVSAVGRVRRVEVAGEEPRFNVEGDDPTYVQWPLICSLYFFLERERIKLDGLMRMTKAAQDGLGRDMPLLDYALNFVSRGSLLKNKDAKLSSQISELARRMDGIAHVLDRMVRECPPVIKKVSR